jgi:hypothetical protein
VSGELGGWRSKLVLERATQEHCFHINNKSGVIDWSAEFVKRLNKASNWSFPRHSASENAYAPYHYDEHTFWCVKIFLETCAANNLGIKFTC